jgi:hypothetical protein
VSKNKNKFLPEYGELNKLQDNSGKHRLNIDSTLGSSINSIRKTVQRTYTSKEIHPGPYVGIVLRVHPSTDGDDVFTKMDNWLSGSSSWSIKVRIPEIHSHLPSPLNVGPTENVSAEDDGLIKSHTTFRPKSEAKIPEVGDYVRVEYKNGSGVYLETITDSSGNARKVDVPTKGVSAKNSFKDSEPAEKGWADGLKEGIKGLFQ